MHESIKLVVIATMHESIKIVVIAIVTMGER